MDRRFGRTRTKNSRRVLRNQRLGQPLHRKHLGTYRSRWRYPMGTLSVRSRLALQASVGTLCFRRRQILSWNQRISYHERSRRVLVGKYGRIPEAFHYRPLRVGRTRHWDEKRFSGRLFYRKRWTNRRTHLHPTGLSRYRNGLWFVYSCDKGIGMFRNRFRISWESDYCQKQAITFENRSLRTTTGMDRRCRQPTRSSSAYRPPLCPVSGKYDFIQSDPCTGTGRQKIIRDERKRKVWRKMAPYRR